MPKLWMEDTAMVDALTDNLTSMIYKMPKYFVRLDEISHTFSMPLSHIQILCLLREGSISVGEISTRLGIAKPNVTPLMEALGKAGYVQRERYDLDHRMVMASLLPKGEELVAQIMQAIREQVEQWPTNYNPSEIKRLNSALSLSMEMADDLMAHRK